MAKLSLVSRFPATVDFEGTQVDINVKRLDVDAFYQYEEQFFKYARPMPGIDTASEGDARERAQALLTWARESFRAYVTLNPNVIEYDGKDVVDGEAFFTLLGGQINPMMETLTQIWAQNRLPENVRKNLRSLSASATTSSESNATSLEADGPKPDQTVASVEPPISAATADVAPEEIQTPSGETTE